MILTIFIISNVLWFLVWLDLRIAYRKLLNHYAQTLQEDLADAIKEQERATEMRKQIKIIRDILTKKSA